MSNFFKVSLNPDHNAISHAEFCRQVRINSAFGECGSIHLELLVLTGIESILIDVKQAYKLSEACYRTPEYMDAKGHRALKYEEIEVCHACLLAGLLNEATDDSGLCEECLPDTVYECGEWPVFNVQEYHVKE